MKKTISFFILLIATVLYIGGLTNTANAAALHQTNEFYNRSLQPEGNLYTETTVEILHSGSKKASKHGSPAPNFASTVTAKKTTTCRSRSGHILWAVSVIGTFSYNGNRATCKKSSVSTSVSSSNWKILTAFASQSGPTATAKATAAKYINGRSIKTISKSVSLTCNKNGSLH